MAFWSSSRLQQALNTTNLIQPVKYGRVKQGAYELSVAAEYSVTSEPAGTKRAERHEQLRIPPGQLAILITQETISMPPNTIGFISMKFKYKAQGLINVSGFHVDPGFHGRLKFSVYNAGSKEAYFSPGQSLFPIWFSELTDPEDPAYNGEHQNQDGISGDDNFLLQGDIASPAQLRKELDALKYEVGFLRIIGIGIFLLLLGIFVKYLLDRPQPSQALPSAPANKGLSAARAMRTWFRSSASIREAPCEAALKTSQQETKPFV